MIIWLPRKNKKIKNEFVEPDEIFLDAQNLPKFDTQQFEGRIERPISKKSIAALAICFAVIGILLVGRIGLLQIIQGAFYRTQSENNSLLKQPLFAERGVFFDRNGIQLVNNVPGPSGTYSLRQYYDIPGFSHLLGYVSYPKKDQNGVYWQTSITGVSGAEEEFNSELSGTSGSTLYERDAYGNIISQNQIDPAIPGKNITLSIDANVQAEFYQAIQQSVQANGFNGGTGLMMDLHTGEIIAMTSYPEYDSNVLSAGTDVATIDGYLHNPANPFLNRAISGLYTPGSIVKPYIALAALEDGVITPDKQILSTGQIEIPDPFDPNIETIFKDNAVHGWVDMIHAIAVSSNVYFYEIGGGFQDQQGLGITRLHDALAQFGLDSKTGIQLPDEVTGVVPDVAWKAQVFPGDPWRVGDTYHTAIGQYGTQVTPIEMLRAVAAIGNGGTLLTPSIQKGVVLPSTTIPINQADLQVVQTGMRLCVTGGTGASLNVPEVAIAEKTGTAQIGVSNTQLNSWSMGYFPYQSPQYAFVVTMDGGPQANEESASLVMRSVVNWMNTNAPQYFQ